MGFFLGFIEHAVRPDTPLVPPDGGQDDVGGLVGEGSNSEMIWNETEAV
jgi:hypothetical protein